MVLEVVLMRRAWAQIAAALCTVVVVLCVSGLGTTAYHRGLALSHGDKDHRPVTCETRITREEALPVSVRTATTDAGATVSGTLTVSNQGCRTEFVENHAYTSEIVVAAGGIAACISDMTADYFANPSVHPDVTVPEGADEFNCIVWYVACGLPENFADHGGSHAHYVMHATTSWTYSASYSLSVTGSRIRRDRTATATHGRSGAPVYGVESHATDTWEVVRPASWSASIAGVADTGTQEWTSEGWFPLVSTITAAAFSLTQLEADCDAYPCEYASATLDWDDVSVDFSGRSTTFGSGDFKITGSGNELVYEALRGFDVQYSPYGSTVTHARPLVADFSGVSIVDRAGVLQGAVQVSGGFMATQMVPASMSWLTASGDPPDPGDTVYPTVTQLRAAGAVVINGASCITGLTLDDADYGYDLHGSGTIALSILEASARTNCICDDDLTMELRVPGVDNTACDSGATRDYAMVSFAHRDDVGLYGPTPAQDHTDWTGTGGAATPDAGGDFAVTGGADTPTLTLLPASSYDDRLARIPLMTAPEAAPYGYWHRRADHYYPADGDPEAVYCWLWWSWLSIPLTAPEACTLTLTVTGRRYIHADTHVTGSTRQTDYEYATTDTVYTYSVAVAAGAQDALVQLMGPAEDEHPEYERVTSIALSGMVAGDWTIGEPTLVLQAGANNHCMAKTFEGHNYLKGGFSAHVDAVFEGGAGDTDHGNHQEWTVPFWDYIVGVTSGIDTTSAISLSSYAALLQNVADAWTAAMNTAVHEAATKDSETPPNQLSTWAFDLCHPIAASTPPEQSGDAGTLMCSLRCGSWTIVAGLVYYICTDKVVEGRAHGRVSSSDGAIIYSAGALAQSLYRRETGSGDPWELVQALTGDAQGHWSSGSLPEIARYDGTTPVLWEYGLGETVDAVGSIGAAYTREYVASGLSLAVMYEPYMDVDECGLVWLVTEGGGALRVYYLDARDHPSRVQVTRPTTATGYDRPSIAVRGGQLLVAATDTAAGNTTIWRSYDRGETWAEVATDLGTGLTLGTVGVRPSTGEVMLCGLDTSYDIKLRSASDGNLARDDFTAGVDELTVVASAADMRSQVVHHPDGSILVAVQAAGDTTIHRCRSFATGFAVV
jgi:hypothetical protein